MTASRTPRRWLPGWVTASLWLVALVSVPLLIDQWRHRDAPDSLPAQVLVDLEGTRLDLHQMSRARPVLVYFWATWCPICRLVSMTSGVTTPPGISLRLWRSGLLGSGGGE